MLGIVDIHHPHRIFVIRFAVLWRELPFGVGWLQFEDDVRGVAHDASFAIGPGGGENGLDLVYKVVKVEN